MSCRSAIDRPPYTHGPFGRIHCTRRLGAPGDRRGSPGARNRGSRHAGRLRCRPSDGAVCGFELVCAVELSTRPNEKVHPENESDPCTCLAIGCSPLHQRNSAATFRPSRQAAASATWIWWRSSSNWESRSRLRTPKSTDETRWAARISRACFVIRATYPIMQEAFDLYLADEAQAAVDRDEPTLEQGIRRISESGGIASLAHPVRLPQRGAELERILWKRLIEVGLAGNRSLPQRAFSAPILPKFAEIARRFGLIPTGGSDLPWRKQTIHPAWARHRLQPPPDL